jgi:hypothetical protein
MGFFSRFTEAALVPTVAAKGYISISKSITCRQHSINLFGFTTDVGDVPLVCSSEATKEKRET